MNDVWKDHSKHIFVLTAAGKPVFSRYGDDHEQTAITSIITAVVGRTLDTADPIKTIVAGDTTFVCSLRGPFYLMAVCRTGESVHHLLEQLRAVHGIIIMTLTAKIEQRLLERSGFDVRPSLVGTRNTFLNLFRLANRTPSFWLDAIPVLTLPTGVRSRILSTLASTSQRCGGVVYAILIAGSAVAGWAQTRNKEYALRSHDLLLLINFVQSSQALRVADTWSPVCLPALNAGGFLHAFISYMGSATVQMPASSGRPATVGAVGAGAGAAPAAGKPAPAIFLTTAVASASPADTAGVASNGDGAEQSGRQAHRATMPPKLAQRGVEATLLAEGVRSGSALIEEDNEADGGEAGVDGDSCVGHSLAGDSQRPRGAADGDDDDGASVDSMNADDDDDANLSKRHVIVGISRAASMQLPPATTAALQRMLLPQPLAAAAPAAAASAAAPTSADAASVVAAAAASLATIVVPRPPQSSPPRPRLPPPPAQRAGARGTIVPPSPASGGGGLPTRSSSAGRLASGPRGSLAAAPSSAAAPSPRLSGHFASSVAAEGGGGQGADEASAGAVAAPAGLTSSASAGDLCALSSSAPDASREDLDGRLGLRLGGGGGGGGAGPVEGNQRPTGRLSRSVSTPAAAAPAAFSPAFLESMTVTPEATAATAAADQGGGSLAASLGRSVRNLALSSAASSPAATLRVARSASNFPTAASVSTTGRASGDAPFDGDAAGDSAAAAGGDEEEEGGGEGAAGPSCSSLQQEREDDDASRAAAAADAAANGGRVPSASLRSPAAAAAAATPTAASLRSPAADGAAADSPAVSPAPVAAAALPPPLLLAITQTPPLAAAATPTGTAATSATPAAAGPAASTAGVSAAAAGGGGGMALHPDVDPPGVFLLLVTSETSAPHVAALAARKAALAASLAESGAMAAVFKSLAAAAGPPAGGGVGDFAALAFAGVPGLLHFVYLWKPARQYTMARFPGALAEHTQRKALLRAYQATYDRLTATAPPLRHCVSSWGGPAWPAGAVGHVAGIHTTSALLLAALDASVPPDRVPAATERLAKALRREHDKVLLLAPGVLQ